MVYKHSNNNEPMTGPFQTPRTEWVLKWPGQVVIAGCQTFWTKEVTEALLGNDLEGLYKRQMGQV